MEMTKLIEWFRAASPARQMQVAILGVCGLTLLMTVVWFAFLRTTYSPLFSDLKPADAATIVSVLERKKVAYKLADGGATILVPDDAVEATRLDVMSEDVPLKGTVGFELFNKSDMGLTDFAQRINYQRALQGELERTIMALDAVETARVHLSLGEDRLFREDRVPPKASVTIRMARQGKLGNREAMGVKRLVAAAVPNLDPANVVILNEDGVVVGDDTSAAQAPAVTPEQEEQRAIEQYYEARIRTALDQAVPNASVTVSVRADSAALAPGGLSAWSPSNRQFPLEVTLSAATPLNAVAQDAARQAAVTVIATSAAQADVIAFGAATPAPTALGPVVDRDPVRAQAPPLLSDATSTPTDASLLFDTAAALAGLLALLLGIALLLRRLRGPRRLSARGRDAFVTNLKAALEEADGHVSSQT